MSAKQVDIYLRTQAELLATLTPDQLDAWYDHCLTLPETGDIVDGLTDLIKFIENDFAASVRDEHTTVTN